MRLWPADIPQLGFPLVLDALFDDILVFEKQLLQSICWIFKSKLRNHGLEPSYNFVKSQPRDLRFEPILIDNDKDTDKNGCHKQ